MNQHFDFFFVRFAVYKKVNELGVDIGDVSGFSKRQMGSNGEFDAMLEVINEHFRLDFEEKAATHKHGENSGVTHNAIVGDGLCQLHCTTCGNKRGQVVDSAELGKVCLPCGNAPEVIGRKQQSFCSGYVVSYSILLPTVVKKPLRFPELCEYHISDKPFTLPSSENH